jgi:hypothetical protein
MLLVLWLVLLLLLLRLLVLLLLLMVWLMWRTERSRRRRRRGRPTGRWRPARENGEGVFAGYRWEHETAAAANLLLLLVECGVRLLWRRGAARQVGFDVGHARRVLVKLGRQGRSHLLVPLGCCSNNEY